MKEKVLNSLEKLRPIIKISGGDIELIDINNDGIVLVKLKGKCKNCPVTNISIKTIIENSLIKEVSGVKYVLGI